MISQRRQFKRLAIALTYLSVITITSAESAKLIRHFKFDGDFTESVFGNPPTAVIGNPIFRQGVSEEAVQLDGQSGLVYDDYYDLNVDTFTLSAWVYPHTDKAWGNVASKGWRIYWLFLNTGEVRAGFYDGSRSHGSLSAIYLKKDVWYFTAVTYDGEFVRVYIDGHLHWIYKAHTKPIQKEGSFMIGARGADFPKYFLDASIDDVRLYNGALNSGQIADLYNNTR